MTACILAGITSRGDPSQDLQAPKTLSVSAWQQPRTRPRIPMRRPRADRVVRPDCALFTNSELNVRGSDQAQQTAAAPHEQSLTPSRSKANVAIYQKAHLARQPQLIIMIAGFINADRRRPCQWHRS